MDQDFTLDDFRNHLNEIQKAGIKNMLARMPGVAGTIPEGEDPDVAVGRIRRMLDAMTDEERADSSRIDAPARQRIAAAAGSAPAEVERFLDGFADVRDRMRRMMNMSIWQRLGLVLGFRRFRPPPGR